MPNEVIHSTAAGNRSGVARSLLSFRVLLAAGLVFIYLLTINNRFNDPDLWFHLKLGETVWSTHAVPSMDTFSHTVYGHPWTAHEWLAQLGIYAAYRMGGYSGLMAVLAILGSVLFLLVYTLSYRYSGDALVAFLGGVAAVVFRNGRIRDSSATGGLHVTRCRTATPRSGFTKPPLALGPATAVRSMGQLSWIVFLWGGNPGSLLGLLLSEW